jgi:hypothetical protein
MKLSNGVKFATFSLQVHPGGQGSTVLGTITRLAARGFFGYSPPYQAAHRPLTISVTGEITCPLR